MSPQQLNVEQRTAAEHPSDSPLLIIAGAGTGKTNTLAHRVAHLLASGADPRRLLLLTFSRRAAGEMTRRASRIVNQMDGPGLKKGSLAWSGTFHAVANRLLRLFAEALGLDPSFTVLDRSDTADLLDLVRHEQGLTKQTKRFPKKATCHAICSRVVNTQRALGEVLESAFPWCREWEDELRALFAAFTVAKQERHVLDYDDLLLYWYFAMQDAGVAGQMRSRFDHVLVDEYQDTNVLQSAILRALKPDGKGLTVVGDDAQSIYSFRAADVKNILEFPAQFDPPAHVVTLSQNYRSTQTILAAANTVMSEAEQGFGKNLFSTQISQEKPVLVTTDDETTQVQFVVEKILEKREAGVALQSQAVLFRASHHSDLLEVELGRRNIPYVKFGGLKFLEAAHVKDMIAVLRWAENPHDQIAGFRVVQLLPGVGPAVARRAIDFLADENFDLAQLKNFPAPQAARSDWGELCVLLSKLCAESSDWHGQVGATRTWYQPHLERIHDSAYVRAGDLEQLETLSGEYASRERFLSDLILDPPQGAGDHAGPPHLDEEFLILSTIHSAKGQEWDTVFVLNAADGCIPSDMATDQPEQIEEERRLLYVAMTRAKRSLYVVHPLRFFVRTQHRYGDRHIFTPVSRFVTAAVRQTFDCVGHGPRATESCDSPVSLPRVDVAEKLRRMWG